MGGSQYQVKLLVDALAMEPRYRIHYLAHRTRPGFPAQNHQVSTIRGPAALRRYTDVVDALPLYRTLGRIRPHLIYQRSGSGYTGIAAHYARTHAVPMIWHVASDIEVRPFDRALRVRAFPKYVEKKVLEYGLRHATRVVVQTERQRDLLARCYGREDAVVVRNFHPLPEEPVCRGDRVRVVWIGNLKPIKQPERFLELADALRAHPGLEFVMIGAPSDRAAWQRAFDARVSRVPNLAYLGALSQEAVNRELARSHLLVNTSANEGFSNTFIQAWMRGVPVASLQVDPDDVLQGAGMGFCARGSMPDLISMVEHMATDGRAALAALSERVAEESRARYSLDNLRQLSELIAGTLDGTKLTAAAPS